MILSIWPKNHLADIISLPFQLAKNHLGDTLFYTAMTLPFGQKPFGHLFSTALTFPFGQKPFGRPNF
jgi:hypothetical protein